MQGKEEILVSVIIPVYNVEKYIEKCIDSVRQQTYTNIEIICVDDGSPDGSVEIIRGKADDRIRIVHIENSGLSVARNTGLEAAKGKYVYFLDSDDYLELDTIEKLVNCAEENVLDALFFNADTFFETPQIEEQNKGYKQYYVRKGTYEGVYTGDDFFVALIGNWDFKPSACLVFLNRQFLEDIGLQFYPGIVHEDNLFTIRLLQKTQRCMFLDEPLYKRLVRDASIMSGEKSIRHAYGFYVCHREILSYLGEREYSFTYYVALKKYLNIMRNNAINAVKGNEFAFVAEKIREVDATAVGCFLEYVYEAFFVREKATNAEKTKVMVKKSGNGLGVLLQKTQIRFAGVSSKKGQRRCVRKKVGKYWKNLEQRAAKMVPKHVRWFFKVMTTVGPGYFVYRKKLKLHKDKICVSIVMPVYNAGRYLEETLDSLITQNLRNIEIICVDDGSTDNSMEILKCYSATDSRIRILTQEKQGAGAARNYGMSVAQGEYLLFLDADDIFNENLCNQAYYRCMTTKADVCLFGARRLNMQTLQTEPMNWVLQPSMIPAKEPFSGAELSEKLFQITTGCPWSKMFRREFVESTGIHFQNLQNANDTYFVRTHMALAERIVTVNNAFVTYRFNSGTNIQANKARSPFAFYEAFKAIKEELVRRGVFETFEQTYCNMVLKESLFNMKTTGDETVKEAIRALLVKEAFDYFGVKEHGEEYYYNKAEYQEMKELL